MNAKSDAIVLIYSTFASVEDAERCGGALVEQRLAACVNILPAMVSIYEWNGKLGRDEEAVMIVKTRAAVVAETRAELARLHPYDTPAILTLATEDVNTPYASWLRQQTGGAG
jgi:periplasmic divalent cation tolerance protein